MMITTGMSLTGNGNMTAGNHCNLRNQVNVICPQEKDSDLHECIGKRKSSSNINRRRSLLSVDDKSHSANSFHLHANEWLAFWLFLVSSSYFLLRKNVNLFGDCGVGHAEKVSVSDRAMSNASTENDENDTFGFSESSGSPHGSDDYSEISDLDKASYLHCLLSLEDEDSEWLSDPSENPLTPLSYKCDSFTEISVVDSPDYWISLLSLEDEDNEWFLDSKQELECVLDGFSNSSFKGSWGIEVPPSVSTSSSFTEVHCGISVEHLLENADVEDFSADEPLFWPFEGKLNWNSAEPWNSFCISPRKSFVSNFISTRIKGCKQKGNKDLCSVNSETSSLSMWSKSSAKIVPLEYEDEKVALKHGKVVSNNNSFLDKDFDSNTDLPLREEYFALDQELPIETLVGLKEFDGHEGLDSEFNDDIFMLYQSLQ